MKHKHLFQWLHEPNRCMARYNYLRRTLMKMRLFNLFTGRSLNYGKVTLDYVHFIKGVSLSK